MYKKVGLQFGKLKRHDSRLNIKIGQQKSHTVVCNKVRVSRKAVHTKSTCHLGRTSMALDLHFCTVVIFRNFDKG